MLGGGSLACSSRYSEGDVRLTQAVNGEATYAKAAVALFCLAGSPPYSGRHLHPSEE